MFVDANTIGPSSSIEADLCLIGAGAAGIAIARQFRDTGLKVVLLESGGLEYDSSSQVLYDGENLGVPYFHPLACRLRFFGGTTNHWAGYCRPFLDYDFEAKSWIPHSGWPISSKDLTEYYPRAAALHTLPEAGWDVDYWRERIDEPFLPLAGDLLYTKVALIKPLRFGQAFRQDLQQSGNVHVFHGANVIELITNENADRITSVRVATLSGATFDVRSKYFVLSAGGIENARILLASDSTIKNGVGNEFDLVGRFFMDHVRLKTGVIQPLDERLPARLYNIHTRDNINLSFTLSVSEQAQRQHRINSTGVRIRAKYREDTLTNRSYKQLQKLRKKFIDLFRLTGGRPGIARQHVDAVIRDFQKAAALDIGEFVKSTLPIDHITCAVRVEPTPNPHSRITLATDTDVLGSRKVRVDWQLTDTDQKGAEVTMDLLAKDFGRAGLGRVKSTVPENWPENITANYHHMGTTRMSADPHTGVVDRNCKVWEMDNLFVAGSSVFATSGSGTPTLTITALALRLSDHLLQLFKDRE